MGKLKIVLLVVLIALAACESKADKITKIQQELEDIAAIENLSVLTLFNMDIDKFNQEKKFLIEKRPHIKDIVNSFSSDSSKNTELLKELNEKRKKLEAAYLALKK